MKQVRLITDGSCLGNPGPGGWAAILRYGSHSKELSGADSATTNNRMEMTAVIRGLAALKHACEVTVETDSQYVKNGITKWVGNWKRNGWITAQRTPVKNADLWVELEETAARHTVHWRWVKGHADHPDNNRCDKLAKAAAKSYRSPGRKSRSRNRRRKRRRKR